MPKDVTIEDIAPNGDVFFLVGTPPTRKLRVSSMLLGVASGVFKAFLGPHFLEGQQMRDAAGPKEIELPDDDAMAMSDMCNLLHFKPVRVLDRPRMSKSLLAFAVVVDKYACVEALRLQSQGLLLQLFDEHDPTSLSQLLRVAVAAYLLDQPSGFDKATERMTTHTNEEYSTVFSSADAALLPPRLFLALQEKRATAQRMISVNLLRLGQPECGLKCNNNNYDRGYCNAVYEAFSLNYWPPAFEGELTVSYALRMMRAMPTIERVGATCSHTGKKRRVTTADFVAFAGAILGTCSGLCLQCVKEEKADLKPKYKCTEHT